MLSKYKWGIPAISALTICCAIAMPQLVRAEDKIVTATSIQKAPYREVFYTGSVYAVRDHDYKLSEPRIGVSTLWSKNPANGSLSLGVRYCVPDADDTLANSTASLTKVLLLDHNQPLMTIDRPIKVTPSYQRVVRDPNTASELGFWEPFSFWNNDDFWGGVDEPFWNNGFSWNNTAPRPDVTCSAGSSRFSIAPLTDTIAQLPSQTLQMKLIFSNGASSQWKVEKKTVQALKTLLSIRQTSQNNSQPTSLP
jgi:hypothetical protein